MIQDLLSFLGNESFDSGFETPSSTPDSGAVESSRTKSQFEIHSLESPFDLEFSESSCQSIVSYVSKHRVQEL